MIVDRIERMKRKIRKRIETSQLIEGRVIKTIEITKKEAEQLGDRITKIDGVELIIVDKLGNKLKKDCFAYIENEKGGRKCYCLDKLQCQNKHCKFYRNDITIAEIENSIKEYAVKKWGGIYDKRRTNKTIEGI